MLLDDPPHRGRHPVGLERDRHIRDRLARDIRVTPVVLHQVREEDVLDVRREAVGERAVTLVSISAMYASRTGSSVASVILYPRFFRLFSLSRLSLGGPGFTRPLVIRSCLRDRDDKHGDCPGR